MQNGHITHEPVQVYRPAWAFLRCSHDQIVCPWSMGMERCASKWGNWSQNGALFSLVSFKTAKKEASKKKTHLFVDRAPELQQRLILFARLGSVGIEVEGLPPKH